MIAVLPLFCLRLWSKFTWSMFAKADFGMVLAFPGFLGLILYCSSVTVFVFRIFGYGLKASNQSTPSLLQQAEVVSIIVVR